MIAAELDVSSPTLDSPVLGSNDLIPASLTVSSLSFGAPTLGTTYQIIAADLVTEGAYSTGVDLRFPDQSLVTIKKGKWVVYDRHMYREGRTVRFPPSVAANLRQQGFAELASEQTQDIECVD